MILHIVGLFCCDGNYIYIFFCVNKSVEKQKLISLSKLIFYLLLFMFVIMQYQLTFFHFYRFYCAMQAFNVICNTVNTSNTPFYKLFLAKQLQVMNNYKKIKNVCISQFVTNHNHKQTSNQYSTYNIIKSHNNNNINKIYSNKKKRQKKICSVREI